MQSIDLANIPPGVVNRMAAVFKLARKCHCVNDGGPKNNFFFTFSPLFFLSLLHTTTTSHLYIHPPRVSTNPSVLYCFVPCINRIMKKKVLG